jgi:hypothetical protein
MNKNEYIDMLTQENTDEKKKNLYADVIDCLDIALSQEGDDFEIVDTSLGLAELFALIEARGRASKNQCVGPFEVAELFAEKFKAKYVRPSRRSKSVEIKSVSLEDFL